jgi:hypothetical protein
MTRRRVGAMLQRTDGNSTSRQTARSPDTLAAPPDPSRIVRPSDDGALGLFAAYTDALRPYNSWIPSMSRPQSTSDSA